MKANRGSRGIAPLILKLSTKWKRVVNNMSQPLYPGKELWYPLNIRLDGAQNRSGHPEEKKNTMLLHYLIHRPVIQKLSHVLKHTTQNLHTTQYVLHSSEQLACLCLTANSQSTVKHFHSALILDRYWLLCISFFIQE